MVSMRTIQDHCKDANSVRIQIGQDQIKVGQGRMVLLSELGLHRYPKFKAHFKHILKCSLLRVAGNFSSVRDISWDSWRENVL